MSAIIAVPAGARGGMAMGFAQNWLDLGPGDPRLLVFTNTRPANGATAGASPAVTILLAKPSGELVANKWKLIMKSAGGYQAIASGVPTWARLENGNGDWAGDGDAGGPLADVAFKLQSDEFFAGGYVLIGDIAIG